MGELEPHTLDAETQYNLGLMYYMGKDVEQDYSLAHKWFKNAAYQGHMDAQCCLGWMYYSGNGVNQDYAEAYKWCKCASDQGDWSSQYLLIHARWPRPNGTNLLPTKGMRLYNRVYALKPKKWGIIY